VPFHPMKRFIDYFCLEFFIKHGLEIMNVRLISIQLFVLVMLACSGCSSPPVSILGICGAPSNAVTPSPAAMVVVSSNGGVGLVEYGVPPDTGGCPPELPIVWTNITAGSLNAVDASNGSCSSSYIIAGGNNAAVFRLNLNAQGIAVPPTQLNTSLPTTDNVYAIKLLDCSTVLMVGGSQDGTSGFIECSTDQGTTWVAASGVPPLTGPLYCISAPSGSTGTIYVAGANGQVLTSQNSGQAWTQFSNPPGSPTIMGLSFAAVGNGIAAAQSGSIYSMAANGTNWSAASSVASQLTAALIGQANVQGNMQSVDWLAGSGFFQGPPGPPWNWISPAITYPPPGPPAGASWYAMWNPDNGTTIFLVGTPSQVFQYPAPNCNPTMGIHNPGGLRPRP
jgi:hypothetical protein